MQKDAKCQKNTKKCKMLKSKKKCKKMQKRKKDANMQKRCKNSKRCKSYRKEEYGEINWKRSTPKLRHRGMTCVYRNGETLG